MYVTEDYFSRLSYYEEKYGENTIILMQIGHFYEIYGYLESDKVGKIARILGMALTKRKNDGLWMMGFPYYVLDTYIPVLLDNNYTTVVIDQHKTNDRILRKTREVISPSTYIGLPLGSIDDLPGKNSQINWLVSIVFVQTYTSIHVGMSAIDVTTCKNVTYETTWDMHDENVEITSFLKHYEPREILIYGKDDLLKIINPISNFGLNPRVMYHFKDVDSRYMKEEFQDHIIGNVFDNKTLLSNLELLGLEGKKYATASYIHLLLFLNDHNPLLTIKIPYPRSLEEGSHLLLSSNFFDQLDVLPLLDSIDYCSNIMGKRLLRERILSPVYCKKELEKRYDQIDYFRQVYSPHIKHIELILKKIPDIEKLRRKILMKKFCPNDLILIYESCVASLELNNFLVGIYSHDPKLVKEDDLSRYFLPLSIHEFIQHCDKSISMEKFRSYKTDNPIEIKHIFQRGLYPDIDNIADKIEKQFSVFDNHFAEHRAGMGIKLEYSQSMGYHFVCPVSSGRKLKQMSNIIIKENKSFARVTSGAIEETSRNILTFMEEMKELTKKNYVDFIEEVSNLYDSLFISIVKFVSLIDVIKSNYKLSHIHNYCRPSVQSGSKSFFMAKDLRHALMEQKTETKYVPNDVSIGSGHDGMIIYSMNACGKTSLIKACGTSVLLAQMGCFVPASSYELSPFKQILTHIRNEEQPGKSSFVVEMMGLRKILNRADSHTLVIADEITRGTEHVSGSSIFASSVMILAERKANFMFTTHLHNVYEFIKDISNVKTYHLSVLFNYNENQNKNIIFERKLQEGPGESIYGLEVCNFLNMDSHFLKVAFDIRSKINIHASIFTSSLDLSMFDQGKIDKNNLQKEAKTSRYNKNKIMDKCEACGYIPEDKRSVPLDSHHIEGKTNVKSNIIALCKECHRKVHKGEIRIHGYKATSEGIVLKIERSKKIDFTRLSD